MRDEQAKRLLSDPKTSAIAIADALKRVLGDYLAWEPESIWLELSRAGIELPDDNRAKAMAALTLRLVPSFYWDALVFSKTAIAFDGMLANADVLDEASPAMMAWAVDEAGWLLRRANEATWEFGHEPRAYAGIILARAGFVLAPEPLAFAQKALDHIRHEDDLRDEVAARWARTNRHALADLALTESRIDVQIARLAAVELHVRDRRAAAERELAELA